jgi:hypothetical protein
MGDVGACVRRSDAKQERGILSQILILWVLRGSFYLSINSHRITFYSHSSVNPALTPLIGFHWRKRDLEAEEGHSTQERVVLSGSLLLLFGVPGLLSALQNTAALLPYPSSSSVCSNCSCLTKLEATANSHHDQRVYRVVL